MESADDFARGFEQPNMVKIQLEDGGTFWVQDAILCKASGYFTGALQGKFAESRTKELRLPGCTTSTFKHLLFWLINYKIAIMDLNPDDTSDAQEELASLWAVGEMYLLPKLQNEVVDRLLAIFRMSSPRAAGIAAAFELTSVDSELRQLFLFELARDCVVNEEGHISYTPEEMNKFGCIPGFTKAYIEMSVDKGFSHYLVHGRAHDYKVNELAIE